ncbi:DUF4834 family protein [Kriegella aquimaris]|uniref:DUF4834 domain-containing protein n=1 Tax=Kriegella aquimaris TaxID=192904 RepID=A0A1G9NI87_9FLAO|nr:DUF4834 family protein [Kriegella aquimaris]SDL86080.1 protein of unknown function [Kriegella aquimaris]
MAFLKTILIILLVYYLFKTVAKWFGPKLFSYAAKKTEAHFNEKFGQFANQNKTEEEQIGDVIIDKKSAQKSNSSKKVGEYIDFEEVD